MLILNFSHPLTAAQLHHIETLSGQTVEEIIPMAVDFDSHGDFVKQVVELLDQVPIDASKWQSSAWLIVLPSLNFITAVLLAELHGRLGHFPAIARTRPVAGSTPTVYEIAELINLQQVRDEARTHRSAV